MHRDKVVSGNLRPFMPSAFGQKVGNACGVLSSPMQRGTTAPRVHPELTTARSGSLLTRITSASSTMMVGCHKLYAAKQRRFADLDTEQGARHKERDDAKQRGLAANWPRVMSPRE